MEYKASLDLTSKIITGLVTVLFLGIALSNFWMIRTQWSNWTQVGANIFLTTFILMIYGFCYILRPLGYTVDGNRITVKRPFKNYVLDIRKVKKVIFANTDSMKWTLRTFGNGGLFGYFGKFRNKTFGNMTWYATRRSNYVIIETTDNRRIVLTPDDPKMINEIENQMRK